MQSCMQQRSQRRDTVQAVRSMRSLDSSLYAYNRSSNSSSNNNSHSPRTDTSARSLTAAPEMARTVTHTRELQRELQSTAKPAPRQRLSHPHHHRQMASSTPHQPPRPQHWQLWPHKAHRQRPHQHQHQQQWLAKAAAASVAVAVSAAAAVESTRTA